MLVLTRKTNETIRIGPSVTVMVVGVKGRRVKLGVEAPDDVDIQRGELPEGGKEARDGDDA